MVEHAIEWHRTTRADLKWSHDVFFRRESKMEESVQTISHFWRKPWSTSYMFMLHVYGASQVMLAVRSLSANAGDLSHAGSIYVRKNRWRRAWQPTPVFSPGESLVRGGWWATVHGVAKSWTWQKQFSMHVYAHVYAYVIVWYENSMTVCIRSS